MLKKEQSISTWYNRVQSSGEKGFGKSVTVPNQSMSIREILTRFTRGQEVGGSRNPQYSDEDFTELESLDKFEKLDLAREIREDLKNFQNQPPVNKQTTIESSDSASGDKPGDKPGE